MLQIGHQRLDAWAEAPPRLQTGWIVVAMDLAVDRAGDLMATGLDHHRPQGRYLHHLSAADLPTGQIGQIGAAIIAVGGPTLQRDVRLLPAARVALMAFLRTTSGLVRQPGRGLRLFEEVTEELVWSFDGPVSRSIWASNSET